MLLDILKATGILWLALFALLLLAAVFVVGTYLSLSTLGIVVVGLGTAALQVAAFVLKALSRTAERVLVAVQFVLRVAANPVTIVFFVAMLSLSFVQDSAEHEQAIAVIVLYENVVYPAAEYVGETFLQPVALKIYDFQDALLDFVYSLVPNIVMTIECLSYVDDQATYEANCMGVALENRRRAATTAAHAAGFVLDDYPDAHYERLWGLKPHSMRSVATAISNVIHALFEFFVVPTIDDLADLFGNLPGPVADVTYFLFNTGRRLVLLIGNFLRAEGTNYVFWVDFIFGYDIGEVAPDTFFTDYNTLVIPFLADLEIALDGSDPVRSTLSGLVGCFKNLLKPIRVIVRDPRGFLRPRAVRDFFVAAFNFIGCVARAILTTPLKLILNLFEPFSSWLMKIIDVIIDAISSFSDLFQCVVDQGNLFYRRLRDGKIGGAAKRFIALVRCFIDGVVDIVNTVADIATALKLRGPPEERIYAVQRRAADLGFDMTPGALYLAARLDDDEADLFLNGTRAGAHDANMAAQFMLKDMVAAMHLPSEGYCTQRLNGHLPVTVVPSRIGGEPELVYGSAVDMMSFSLCMSALHTAARHLAAHRHIAEVPLPDHALHLRTRAAVPLHEAVDMRKYMDPFSLDSLWHIVDNEVNTAYHSRLLRYSGSVHEDGLEAAYAHLQLRSRQVALQIAPLAGIEQDAALAALEAVGRPCRGCRAEAQAEVPTIAALKPRGTAELGEAFAQLGASLQRFLHRVRDSATLYDPSVQRTLRYVHASLPATTRLRDTIGEHLVDAGEPDAEVYRSSTLNVARLFEQSVDRVFSDGSRWLRSAVLRGRAPHARRGKRQAETVPDVPGIDPARVVKAREYRLDGLDVYARDLIDSVLERAGVVRKIADIFGELYAAIDFVALADNVGAAIKSTVICRYPEQYDGTERWSRFCLLPPLPFYEFVGGFPSTFMPARSPFPPENLAVRPQNCTGRVGVADGAGDECYVTTYTCADVGIVDPLSAVLSLISAAQLWWNDLFVAGAYLSLWFIYVALLVLGFVSIAGLTNFAVDMAERVVSLHLEGVRGLALLGAWVGLAQPIALLWRAVAGYVINSGAGQINFSLLAVIGKFPGRLGVPYLDQLGSLGELLYGVRSLSDIDRVAAAIGRVDYYEQGLASVPGSDVWCVLTDFSNIAYGMVLLFAASLALIFASLPVLYVFDLIAALVTAMFTVVNTIFQVQTSERLSEVREEVDDHSERIKSLESRVTKIELEATHGSRPAAIPAIGST